MSECEQPGHNYFYLIFLACVVLILNFQVFFWLVSAWEFDPYYSHGVLIPFISGLFILMIFWNGRKKFSPGFNLPGSVLMILGMLACIAGYWYSTWWISALSLMPVLLGFLSQISGWKYSVKFLFPVLFLIFMIPLPGIDYFSACFAALSVSFSSTVLQIFGIPVATNGAELVLSNSSFRIGVSCSGLKTLISLLIPSILLIELCVCEIRKKTVLFLLIFPLAFITNIMRILVLVAVTNVYGPEFAMNHVHDVLGLLMPVLVFLGILALTRFMGCPSIKKFNNY